MNNRQRKLITGLLVAVMAAGVCLLLYPTVSDLWNSYHQSKVVASYAEAVEEMSEEEKEAILGAARDYNARLLQEGRRVSDEMTDEERKEYESLLNVDGTGIMGYVEIPEIDVDLAIYHGTSEAVLTLGAGHIEGSSLPVGGKGTHAVISGHRGLPSAKLFTDIDRLEEGSVFYLHILDDILTYEVDQILTVEPSEIEALDLEKGKDYCTLVTCTPYGINSHRLLVRGHRIATPEEILEEAAKNKPKPDHTFFLALGGAGGLAAAGTAGTILYRKRHRRKYRKQRRRRRTSGMTKKRRRSR